MKRHSAVAALLLLAGCGARIVPQSPQTSPPPVQRPVTVRPALVVAVAPAVVSAASGPNARSAGVFDPPSFDARPYDATSAVRALKAFRASCPALLRRTDQSGLTRPDDWKAACDAAPGWPENDAVGFFDQNFEMVQIGDGKAFATGYFEPEIRGSRTRRAGFEVPIYGKPADLAELDLGMFSDALKGKRIRGRVEGGTFVPYPDRAAIEEGALAGRGLEIGWAADPVEFFFLQVQGSGRLRLPDGSVMRIGYDGQNGRDYTGVGKLMRERGLLAPGQATMQGITSWLRANPDQGREIMRENRSWVFFRELTGAGAIGALGVPVSPRGSVAADPAFVPLGAPVVLALDRAEANGIWVAQDTGGAIKGSNRFDTFWGPGEEAARIAGGMSAHGAAFVLLPRGVKARIRSEPGNDATPSQR